MIAVRALAAALAAASALGACASGPGAPSAQVSLARQIADNAAGFNEAYGQAVSAQLLLNILRSRDRLPRFYLSMTGISDSPSLRYSQSFGVGGLPFGGGGTPFGVGNLGAQRETQTRPSYAVEPFSAETLTKAAFEPTASHVFAHYWESGWPRDLLLYLMVDRIEMTGADGARIVFSNEANEIFSNCEDAVQTGGCAFVREVRALLVSIDDPARDGAIDPEHGQPVCGLIAAYGPTIALNPITPAEGADCDPLFAVGSAMLRLRLRSLDDMVYYVGELMRAGAMNGAPGAPMEAQLNVRAAGLRGGGRGVPVFRILPAASAERRIYAAQVEYGGERYAAGPAIGRSCGQARDSGPCADDAEQGDRSSSVLSLLAEIMALNQSPDAIRAPSRVITN